MTKWFCVVATIALVLVAMTSVLACPIPDFVTRSVLTSGVEASFDVYRPGMHYPQTIDIDEEIDYLGLDSVTYTWNWGDGTSDSTGVGVSHTYTYGGEYMITVTATDGDIYSIQDDPDVVYQFYVRVDWAQPE
ncbi:PKD domain-containing protein [bacterium]|nr:PKD domain-containing protein [bacterium]